MDTIERTWRLVRAMARDDDGNPRPSPYDGQGMGRIVIGGGGMAVMMIDWRHDVPDGHKCAGRRIRHLRPEVTATRGRSIRHPLATVTEPLGEAEQPLTNNCIL